jgi:hypothetical protein
MEGREEAVVVLVKLDGDSIVDVEFALVIYCCYLFILLFPTE